MAENQNLAFRLPPEKITEFKKQCQKKYGMDHGDFLREVVEAVFDNRLTIKPSRKQQQLMGEKA